MKVFEGQLTNYQKDVLLEYLLYEKYQGEFVTIDGISQHPICLGFSEWLHRIIERAG